MAKVPSLRHHKPSGRAVVTLSGRDFYLGPYGSNEAKNKYQKLIAEYLASGRKTSFGKAKEAVTIAALICDYLDHTGSTISRLQRVMAKQ